MTRTVNHPHVITIMRALDRAEQSDQLNPGTDALGLVAGAIVDNWISCPERFAHIDHGWTPEGIRAFVLAYALNCPAETLDEAAEVAIEHIAWCEWWDSKGHAEAEGLSTAEVH